MIPHAWCSPKGERQVRVSAYSCSASPNSKRVAAPRAGESSGRTVISCVEQKGVVVVALVADDQLQVLVDVLGADALGVLFEPNSCVHAGPSRDPLD